MSIFETSNEKVMKSLVLKFGLMMIALIQLLSPGKALSYIESINPALNSHSKPANGNITVMFSYEMNASTMNNETVLIDGSQSGRIQSTITYNPTTQTATIDPVRNMKPGEWIHVQLTSGIQTLYHGSIQTYSHNFKVKPIGGSGVFVETLSSQLGTNSGIIGTADFDGDGDLDILAKSTEGSGEKIFIYKNDGTGSFNDSSAKSDIAPGFRRCMFADYDNDGDLDVGIDHLWLYGDFYVRIYKNDGAGVFNYFSQFVNYRLFSLEQGDVDNDEDVDFVVLEYGAIRPFRNDGNGNFSSNEYYLVGCDEYFDAGSIAMDDFDADNDLDLYYLGWSHGEEHRTCREGRCYLNNGNGTFQRYFVHPIPYGEFVAEDLNNDRYIDLLMPGARTIYFYPPLNFVESAYPGSATTGDFDGDADIDLVNPGGANTQPVIYFNDGNGHFTSGSSSGTEGQGGGFPCGDFDNDGDLDIIKEGSQSGEIVLYKNFTTCLISGPTVINLDSTMILFHCSDNDGYWTLVNNSLCNASISGNNSGDSIFVNAGSSEGSFTLSFFWPDSTWHCSRVISVDNPLPVELSGFAATVSGRDVVLNWKTLSEINSRGFDVERASTNRTWSKIGFLSCIGNSNTQTEYSFTDKGLLTGKYNYRLKQIDLNGNQEYFELGNEVEIGILAEFNLSQNYPNPFNPVTKIDYEIPNDGNASLVIYDVNGKEVRKLTSGFKPAGYYTESFDASGLSSGVYFYRLKLIVNAENRDFLTVKKMVLMK